MSKFRKFLHRMGYYCQGCQKIKKTFAPPFGRRVCLSCQMLDADAHFAGLNDIIRQRDDGTMGDTVLAERLAVLKEQFLPSKEEREGEDE